MNEQKITSLKDSFNKIMARTLVITIACLIFSITVVILGQLTGLAPTGNTSPDLSVIILTFMFSVFVNAFYYQLSERKNTRGKVLLSYGILIIIVGITIMSCYFIELSPGYQNFFREVHGNPTASELSSYRPSIGVFNSIDQGTGPNGYWSIAYPIINPSPNLLFGAAFAFCGVFLFLIESINFDYFSKFALYLIIVFLSLVVASGINTLLNTFNVLGETNAFLQIFALWFGTFEVMKELIDASLDDHEKKLNQQQNAIINGPLIEVSVEQK
jgi:hypothetical protein